MEFKKPIYPIEQWNITETEFKKENNYRNETTFALSNGYIGTRGTFEEAYPFDVDTGLEGNFVNGFYESNEIRYGEANFGSPLLSQSLLNLPNLKEIHVILDGEEFTMEQGEVKEYARTLHMKDGILERKLTWTASSGKMTEIHIFRLVSFARKNIMAIRYQVRPVNYAGTVEFVSKMQADVENHTRKTNPIVDYGPFGRRLDPDKVKAENDISYYAMHTNYDVLGMAELSGKIMDLQNGEVLDVTYTDEEGNPEGIGRIGNLEKDMTLEECCVYVKHRLELGSLKVFGDMQKKVHRLAISPGSGKSSIAVALEKGADVLVTGDIGHHDGIDAVEQGLAVIDAGHYGTEYIFIEDMKQFFEKKLPVLDVLTDPIEHPFQII